MRKLWPLALLVAGIAVAGPVVLNPAGKVELTDCAANGGTPAAGTLVRDTTYLMRVTDEDVWVCFAASGATCSSGGDRFPKNTVMLISINGDQKSVRCRSSGATGDIIFTPG